ncbi:MAG: hypothetical protein C0521_13300 [Xanthomonas sp.]|nr:hypothetical protein [Xanthomonas sp.]
MGTVVRVLLRSMRALGRRPTLFVRNIEASGIVCFALRGLIALHFDADIAKQPGGGVGQDVLPALLLGIRVGQVHECIEAIRMDSLTPRREGVPFPATMDLESVVQCFQTADVGCGEVTIGIRITPNHVPAVRDGCSAGSEREVLVGTMPGINHLDGSRLQPPQVANAITIRIASFDLTRTSDLVKPLGRLQ